MLRRLVLALALLGCLISGRPPDHLDLPLLEQILGALSKGGFAIDVARLCQGIVRETEKYPGPIQELAGLRAETGNFERSLHRWAKHQQFMDFFPGLYAFNLMKDHPTEGPKQMKHWAILPHELFSSIYHSSSGAELFELLMTGGASNLEKWWSDASREGGSWYAHHPGREKQPDPTKRIPIGLHGDEAGARGGAEMLVLTWGSTAVSLPTLDSRLCFTILNADEATTDEGQTTLTTIYKVTTQQNQNITKKGKVW